MACHAATSALTSFSFYQDTDKPKGIGFLETLKHPTYLTTILITPGIINSEVSNSKQKKNCGIVELLIPTLNKIIRNQGTCFVVIMNNRLKIISVHGAPL